jgi:hypothetical protein
LSGGPALALLARLSEATRWDEAVRRHERDPRAYLLRKLRETEGPLRAHKDAVYREACGRLLADLKMPILRPGALQEHKEAFEALLPLADYADLSFHLEPGGDRKARHDAAAGILARARPRTLFDQEALPPERRGKAWEKLVAETGRRLGLQELALTLSRKPATASRRAMVLRRARRNLAEYLAVTRGDLGVREEISPFMLGRVEAAIAAMLRFVESV